MTLPEKQAAMRDRAAGNGPIIFASQLAPIVRELLTGSPAQEALAAAMITMIQHLEATIAGESTVEDRNRAIDTLCWIFTNSTRAAQTVARASAKREEAKKRRTRHEAERERQKRAVAEIPLIISRKRAAIQKKLDQALKG
jgi:hypothetical protein